VQLALVGDVQAPGRLRPPPAPHAHVAAGHAKRVTGRQVLDPLQAGGGLVGQVHHAVGQRARVDPAADARPGEDDRDAGGERGGVGPAVQVQAVLRQVVRGRPQPAFARVPDGQRERTQQPLRAALAPALPGPQRERAVGQLACLCRRDAEGRGQLAAVVQAARGDGDVAAVGRDHRLALERVLGRDHRDGGAQPGGLAVGRPGPARVPAPGRERRGQRRHGLGAHRRLVQPDVRGQAAHGTRLAGLTKAATGVNVACTGAPTTTVEPQRS
jgi:hypothetical protein